jgi:integrase/recombinase XerD
VAAPVAVQGPVRLDLFSRIVGVPEMSCAQRLRRLAEAAGVKLPRMHMLRHTFVTTLLDPDVGLRDVQIAGRHADPQTVMCDNRARKNLDRHPHYILAASMASGT